MSCLLALITHRRRIEKRATVSLSQLSPLSPYYISAHTFTSARYIPSGLYIHLFLPFFSFVPLLMNQPFINGKETPHTHSRRSLKSPRVYQIPFLQSRSSRTAQKKKKNPSFWERVLTLSGRSDWYHQINKTHGGKICNWVQKFRYAKTISGLKENSNHRWGFNRTNIFLSSYSDNPELNLINILAGKWRNSITPSLCALCSPVAFSYCSLFII